MRIISIAGKNLASIEGEFRIDFEAGPLAGAGLFALTGPTGSGKSTILDALCLALYDRTPRLSRSGGPLIGTGSDDSGKLNAWDVRSILRRGTGSGHAEVIFASRDDHRYQARWEVRRARESATGRFQNQSVTLKDLDTNQLLGGTRTETLDEIQEKVGLTYDQFCRSVLLAQGEFAAFLKADGKERAELLERITGTDIYSQISTAAFRRMRDEEGRLEILQRQQGDIVVMGDEGKWATQEELATVTRELEITREHLRALERADAWYARCSELRQGVDDARKTVAESEGERSAAEPLRHELAMVESVQHLHPLLETNDRTRDEHAEALRARDELTGQLEAANLAVTRDEEAVTEALKAKEGEERTRDELRPQIDRARELDTRLADGRSRLTAIEETVAAARTTSEEAGRELELCRQEARVVAGELADVRSWLDEHRHLEPLATEWGLVRLELERYVATHSAREAATRDSSRLVGQEQAALKERDAARERLTATDEQLAVQRQGLSLAEERLRGYDCSALREERLHLQSRLERAQEMLTTARTAAAAVQDATEAAAVASEARQEAATACKTVSDGSDGRIRIAAALAEAERALLTARSTLDLEQHRALLTSGEPCPLCGSPDHPWGRELPPVAALITEQEARVGTLRGDKEELERRLAAAEVTVGAATARAEREGERARMALELLGECREKWARGREWLAGAELPATVDDQGVASATENLVEAVGQRLKTIGILEQEAAEAQKSERQAREAVETARSSREEAVSLLAQAEEAHRAALLTREEAERTVKQAGAELDRIIAVVDPHLVGIESWEVALHHTPDTFLESLTVTVASLTDQTSRRDEAARRVATLEPRLAELGARCESHGETLRQRLEELTSHREVMDRLQEERESVLAGRSVTEVEEDLRHRVEASAALVEMARKAHTATLARKADLNGRVDGANRLATDREQAMTQAAAALAETLAQRALAEGDLRALLARGDEWLRESREALRLLDERLQRARTLVEERERVLADHEAVGVPEMAEADLPAAKTVKTGEAAGLEERQFALRHRIETDDNARRRHAELLPLITAQQAETALWQGLADLIGSADGKKFRTFAQSLTLDVLLGYANEHLASLAPRYGIMRIPQAEMELQMVDRDMGDEVRSVNSLSGGEGFLVSLALALGLSSLSAHTTPVESLFVDEGFGTLDQETLELALATLDSLQASGRKVGIISHVPGLAERIGARVEVVPCGGGRSTVRVAGAVG